jgi:hypothetical protein
LRGGNGIDTFVIRTGDGSTTLADANVITDFTNGTDIIAMDSVAYDDLTIAQGTGAYASDTLVRVTATGEYLLIIQNITASSITAADFSNTSTVPQTFTGTSGNDTFVGGAGNDTFNGGAGSDELYGHGGNDTFNITDKSGAFTDTVDGSTGTDTLDIDYTGVADLGDFSTFTYDSSTATFTLTDANDGTINFKSIENLTVDDYAYTRVTDNSDNEEQAYWNSTEKALYLYNSGTTGGGLASDLWGTAYSDELPGLAKTDNVTIKGSAGGDGFNLNVNRTDDYSGNWTINLGAGDDTLSAAALKNGDSVDMGTGDDSVNLMINSHTPTVANLSLVKLDGGTGTDTLNFLNFTNTAEISLSTGGATNFENILGSGGSETIKGDANANILAGAGGADTLYGYGGNDVLAGSNRGMPTLAQVADWDDNDSWNDSNNTGNNTLYGGAGNDKLYGGYFDDTLDGGTGTDTLSGGSGIDTFVIRTGDGSTTLADANVITDFQDGTDLIGLDNDFNFSQLTIFQGTGAYASHTLVRVIATGEYLLIIQNITASNITDLDFTAVEISEPSRPAAYARNQEFSNDDFTDDSIILTGDYFAASAIAAEDNPLGSAASESFTENITLPDTAPVDGPSFAFSEEDALSLLSELIDLNSSDLIDDETLLLADLSDSTPLDQPATEYAAEATDLVADLSFAGDYDGIMHNDILVGVSELG